MGENFLDLKKAVENWAWREFEKTATKNQTKLKKKHDKSQSYLGLKVDWSDVKFREETRWDRMAQDEFGDDVNENKKGAAAAGSGSAQTGAPHTSVLFQTKFTNNTAEPQEYCMKTEKTTQSSIMVSRESGYTRGIDFGISLKSPGEVMEANAGYHREYTLTNTEEQTFEEELSWGVESQIRVKEGHVADAQLVVCEKKQKGGFTMETKISGTVYVSFTSIRDNNSLIKASGHDIVVLLEEHVKMERRKGRAMECVDISDGVVTVTTRGTCNFRYGVRQEVRVDQKPLIGQQ